MALYTKQQLIDAYIEATDINPSEVDHRYMAAEVIRVQAEIDKRINRLTTRKANFIAERTAMVNQIQTQIDNVEPDAKKRMKNIALAYIARQTAIQSTEDNDGVSL